MVAVPVNPGQFCKQPCLSKGWDAGAEPADGNTAAGFLARAPLGRPRAAEVNPVSHGV